MAVIISLGAVYYVFNLIIVIILILPEQSILAKASQRDASINGYSAHVL